MPTMYHQLRINAPINKTFDAVTKPELFINWWPLTCNGHAKVGGEYEFYFGDPYRWNAVVTTLESNERVEYKMTKADEDWTPTSFGFLLSHSADNQVILNFYHKDWQIENDHFKIATYCWAHLLKGLKDFSEKDIIIPFELRS